ncbi:magnesium/cobalt transporter CorA [Saccharospirillum impatiens]|uniref:magnesium/cobalt transporter CorA n=1 Tax=Saccharospirillum impatiens TaxID=169438 RepID=UPI00040E968B|nr:magnesium/cobalt transporter CorA [Saccharospirillum impatiens]
MLRLFKLDQNTIHQFPNDELTEKTIADADWLDAHEPDAGDRELINALMRSDLPQSSDVSQIESSARYFVDDEGVHVHSLFLSHSEGRHKTATVAFILQAKRLITVREGKLADFRLLRLRARRGQVEATSPADLMMTIFEQKVENLADFIEDIHRDLEGVSKVVLEEEDSDLEWAIDQLAKLEDSNGKIRLCLMDTQRSLTFLQRQIRSQLNSPELCNEVLHDIETLLTHTSFLFDKINFLMDSTQGFININQNKIIKTFSIAAVVFLPPTLVASIYGMNFNVMPELNWMLGYPMALVLMLASGIAPYWFFKHKGWL